MIYPQPKAPKPLRDPGYRKWLRTMPCAAMGAARDAHLSDGCWSPDDGLLKMGMFWFLSDAAHGHKATSGRVKVDDRTCIPLCRRHHEEQELNMDAFDLKHGINRVTIAAELYKRYEEERVARTGSASAKEAVEGFVLTEAMRSWGAKNTPSVPLDDELEAWKDRCRENQYRTKVGAIADAAASFRRACRNAEEWGTYGKRYSDKRSVGATRKEE